VVWVADRGLLTNARIEAELRPDADFGWITALRAPAVQALRDEGVLQLSLFDQHDLAEIRSSAFPGERLVACRNPLLGAERARKREALLQATEKELEKIVTAVARERRPLRGQDAIGVRVGRVLGRFKMAKHFRYEITDAAFRFERDPERIENEAALDGRGSSRGLQEPVAGGAGLPLDQDRPRRPPASPPHRAASPGARLPLHACLLRGVASAPLARAAPLPGP
jgi:hypothetical protein